MSPSKNGDFLYLMRILEHIGKIWIYVKDIKNAHELSEENDQKELNAILTLLSNIGENISKISESTKHEYSQIPWKEIKGFRNKIVHEYIGIDVEMVYKIITKDLKILKPEISKIIKNRLNEGIFEIECLQNCMNNKYYKHIDFDEII